MKPLFLLGQDLDRADNWLDYSDHLPHCQSVNSETEILAHSEQYRMLRTELEEHLKEAYRTESWGAAATGGAAAWVVSNSGSLPEEMRWVPVIIIAFCGLRCLLIYFRIHMIGTYLRMIEEQIFREDSGILGWERYLLSKGRKAEVIRVILWILVLISALIGSVML